MAPPPPQPRRRRLSANKSVFTILFALPVKSLLRFKCVSKTWNDAISHPGFRDTYNARRASSSVPRFFFFQGFDFDYDQRSGASLHRFATLNSAGVPLDVLPITVFGGPIKLVLPSSRGLLCFATETCVYLCNPSTHSLVQLPPLHGGSGQTIAGFGFGYMGSTGEYKVARLVHKPEEGYYVPCKLECSVFTYPATQPAVTNAWKVLADPCPYFVAEFSLPVFVCGAESVYWKINQSRHCRCNSKAGGRQDAFLVYLDIKKERFGVVRGPQGWRRAIHGNPPRIMEDQPVGKLRMIETPGDLPLRLVVWVLADQQNSHWVKQAIVSLPPLDNRTILGEIKVYTSDWIIFSSPDNIIIFVNKKKGTVRKVGIPTGLRNLDFCTYTENLLTLRLPPYESRN
ncbi:unnamed protein product [Linum trigynum]|uniref:F-box domain-containing protein n=1 Tax=Linum trigynum TaxID=586398 RepID=A0AAV2F3F3_9ROSI